MQNTLIQCGQSVNCWMLNLSIHTVTIGLEKFNFLTDLRIDGSLLCWRLKHDSLVEAPDAVICITCVISNSDEVVTDLWRTFIGLESLKMKAKVSFETSGTTIPATQRHISQDQNRRWRGYGSVRFHGRRHAITLLSAERNMRCHFVRLCRSG